MGGAANMPGCGGKPRPAAAAAAAAAAEETEDVVEEDPPALLTGRGGVGRWAPIGGVPSDGGPLLLDGTPG